MKRDITSRIDAIIDNPTIESIEYPKQETMFNTSKINIEVNQAIAYAETTGICSFGRTGTA